jgi:thiol-disulfide isomerase/thioredoxin
MKKIFLILVFLMSASSFLKASEIKADPTLVITKVDGKIFDLKEKRGKVVLINFWAEWCASCRKEMLVLDEIYQKYKSHNLEIISINIEGKNQRQKVLELLSPLSYPNALLIDAKETNLKKPSIVPMSYAIDKNGKLVTKIIPRDNEIKKEDFEEILKPLLEVAL